MVYSLGWTLTVPSKSQTPSLCPTISPMMTINLSKALVRILISQIVPGALTTSFFHSEIPILYAAISERSSCGRQYRWLLPSDHIGLFLQSIPRGDSSNPSNQTQARRCGSCSWYAPCSPCCFHFTHTYPPFADISQTARGNASFRAFRLTKAFLDAYKKNNFSTER